jgi:hypothetical protein
VERNLYSANKSVVMPPWGPASFEEDEKKKN